MVLTNKAKSWSLESKLRDIITMINLSNKARETCFKLYKAFFNLQDSPLLWETHGRGTYKFPHENHHLDKHFKHPFKKYNTRELMKLHLECK